MIAGNWCLYEKRSNRWLFHRRKRLMGAPLLIVLCAILGCALVWSSHF